MKIKIFSAFVYTDVILITMHLTFLAYMQLKISHWIRGS